MTPERIISVFGSSHPRETDPEYLTARALGQALATTGFAVCTGGYGGTMEAVCRGAKDAGGKTYGVTADFFPAAKANEWVDVEVRVKTWQERLFEIINLADAFVACPGGTGTLTELAVTWEMMNKSVITVKPFLTLGTFWEPILKCIRQAEIDDQNPGSETNSQLLSTVATPEDAAAFLARSFDQKP